MKLQKPIYPNNLDHRPNRQKKGRSSSSIVLVRNEPVGGDPYILHSTKSQSSDLARQRSSHVNANPNGILKSRKFIYTKKNIT